MVPGGRATRVTESPPQGPVDRAGQDQAGTASTRTVSTTQGGSQLGEPVRGLGAMAGAEVVLRDGSAQAAVAERIASQDGQASAVVHSELGAVDGGQAVRTSGFSVLDDTGQAVVVGQGECLQTQLNSGGDEVLRLVGAIKEGIGGMSVKLGVAMSGACQTSGRLGAPRILEHMYTLQVCSTPGPSPIPALLALRCAMTLRSLRAFGTPYLAHRHRSPLGPPYRSVADHD